MDMQMYLSFIGIALHCLINWSLYTSELGHYRVFVPDEMETRSKELRTALGKVVMHTSFVEWAPKEGQHGVFMVHYYDIPTLAADISVDSLNEQVLDTIVDELKQLYDGQILYHQALDVSLGIGQLLRIDYNKGQSVMKAKIMLYKGRIFVVQVLAEIDWALHDSVDKFLDSFELLE